MKIPRNFASLLIESSTGYANATLALYYAGKSNQLENFENFYQYLYKTYQFEGIRIDDLAEDCVDEMIVEEDASGGGIRHIFLRLVGDVIVVASMKDYDPREEDEMREMLSTLTVGNLVPEAEIFSKIEMELDLDDWDRIGDVAFRLGGTQ